jgi:hypothetical protein
MLAALQESWIHLSTIITESQDIDCGNWQEWKFTQIRGFLEEHLVMEMQHPPLAVEEAATAKHTQNLGSFSTTNSLQNLTHIDWNPMIRFGNFTSIYEECTNSMHKIAGITQYSKPLARLIVTNTNKFSCVWDLIMSWYLHALCHSYDKGHAQ